jgi:hypothetical protein
VKAGGGRAGGGYGHRWWGRRGEDGAEKRETGSVGCEKENEIDSVLLSASLLLLAEF